jgi:hypothetical protein
LFKFFKKHQAEAEPSPSPSPEWVAMHLDDIPGAMKLVDGFPRVDWSLVSQSLEPHSKHPSIGQMWTQLAEQWLGTICQRLGDEYHVYESAHMLVMSSQAPQRPLPRWLNEGLAQFAEDLVPGYRPPIIDHREVRLQHRYWSWFGTSHFWSGKAFDLKSSQRVSYKLAEVLFRNLVSDRRHRRGLAKFLATAHRQDAGAAACEECFGCSLSDLVEGFLGPGSWGCTAKK